MTRPVQVITPWERFKRLTVWHPLNTDPADDKRWGPRLWYPTYDLLAIALGFYALILGSPLLNRLFPPWFTDGMGLVLIAGATLCLVGVCIPRFYYLELLGKLVLVFMLAAYAGTVAGLSRTDEPNGFVVIVLIMSVWLLMPRVSELLARLFRVPFWKRSFRKRAG